MSLSCMNYAHRYCAVLVLAVLATVYSGTCAVGRTFTFNKVVDSNTLDPGNASGFDFFYEIDTDGQNIAFNAYRNDGSVGVYRIMNGDLQLVADQNTIIPGTSDYFEAFDSIQIDGDHFAFKGGSSSQGGMLFAGDSNGVSRLFADPINVGGSLLTLGAVQDYELIGDDVGCIASSSWGGRGVYTLIDGVFDIVADTETPIPDGIGTFDHFWTMDFNGEAVVFYGFQSITKVAQAGIYKYSNGSYQTIVDRTTKSPVNPVHTFDAFSEPTLDGDDVYFRGDWNNQSVDGIYSDTGTGNLNVEMTTLYRSFPFGDGGRFTQTALSAVSDGNILMVGTDTLHPYVNSYYLRYNDEWYPLLRAGDMIDGVEVERVRDFVIEGDLIVLSVFLTNNTTAIYTVTVPEPASLFIMTTASLAVLRRTNRRMSIN